MEESPHRWITPEGKKIEADHFWGLIYKYCLFYVRHRISKNSEDKVA